MLGSGPTFYGLETLPGQCHSDEDLRWCVRYESDVIGLRKMQKKKAYTFSPYRNAKWTPTHVMSCHYKNAPISAGCKLKPVYCTRQPAEFLVWLLLIKTKSIDSSLDYLNAMRTKIQSCMRNTSDLKKNLCCLEILIKKYEQYHSA